MREGRRENSTEPLRWKDDRPWTIWPSNRVAGRPLSRTRWAPWCVYKCVSISLSLSRTFVSKQGEYNKKSSQDLSSYFEAKSGKKSARYL